LISHQRLSDTYQTTGQYTVNAYINHRSGIQSANLFYTTDTLQPFQTASMNLTDPVNHTWSAAIPAQPAETKIWYYISAVSVSGKSQVRPITAPTGRWMFRVLSNSNAGLSFGEDVFQKPAFPNPSAGITCIPVHTLTDLDARLFLTDMHGRVIRDIFCGKIRAGLDNRYYTDVSDLPAGIYHLVLQTDLGTKTQKLAVRK
jgi:hypothetical protein